MGAQRLVTLHPHDIQNVLCPQSVSALLPEHLRLLLRGGLDECSLLHVDLIVNAFRGTRGIEDAL